MQLQKQELQGILWKVAASPLAAGKLLSSSHHEKQCQRVLGVNIPPVVCGVKTFLPFVSLSFFTSN